jgi:hypothetical protein
MSHLDVLTTVNMPLRAEGCSIVNRFGAVIATACDLATAEALVTLANYGQAEAQRENVAQRRGGLARRQSVNAILRALDSMSVLGESPDMRRILREEAANIRAAVQVKGDVGAAMAEAQRVADMWGVRL